MTLQPLPGFKSLETHHCITGSLRHVYVYNDHNISEEMLLGLGGGVGFVYWHVKGQPPFIGGRGNARGGFEPLAGQRTGVKVEAHSTSSARKAEQALLEILDAGQPVMIQCDMGCLPYFDFGGSEYHFGGHVVVVCGYDRELRQVLIADRDKELHVVSMDDLEKARSSTYQPFPPRNTWYTFDFSGKRQPTAGEVRQAIAEQAHGMLEPPIRNFGVSGIRKAGKMIPRWPDSMGVEELRWSLFNTYVFISPVGGSGGGLFRTMFGRFLREAAQVTGDTRLDESADEFQRIGEEWEALGEWFRQVSEMPAPASRLGKCVAPLNALAAMEETAWKQIRDIV
jgi:hypothetical protein